MIRRLAGLAFPLVLLAACQSASPPVAQARQGRVDAERAAYCRQRAEEIYLTQNRGDLYRGDSRDTPFSGGYVPSVTSRGLSDRYAQDRMIADCIRNTGERTDPTVVPQPGTLPSGSVGPGFSGPSTKAPPPPPPVR